MISQLKLLCSWVFLLLALSFCHCKNVTVHVVGTINCTDCVKQYLSNSQASSGLTVTMHCNSRTGDMKIQGNSAIDTEGKFNITLPAQIMEDKISTHRCYAKLQSESSAQCPTHKARTASMKILNSEASPNVHRPIKFSPITCQSAFFWPFIKCPPKPNFMVPYTQPPTEYTPSLPPVQPLFPPPPPEIPNLPATPSLPPPLGPEVPPFLPPSPAPKKQPCPPQVPAFNQPSPLSAPIPKFQKPIPPPSSEQPFYNSPPSSAPKSKKPIPPPFFNSPSSSAPISKKPFPPPPKGKIFNQPPQPFYRTPYVPSQSPFLPPSPAPNTHYDSANAPPIPFEASPKPFPIKATHPPAPQPEKQISPIYRKPNPIPRAPPVPQLPPIAAVPRKYFNPPKSESQPPISSHNPNY